MNFKEYCAGVRVRCDPEERLFRKVRSHMVVCGKPISPEEFKGFKREREALEAQTLRLLGYSSVEDIGRDLKNSPDKWLDFLSRMVEMGIDLSKDPVGIHVDDRFNGIISKRPDLGSWLEKYSKLSERFYEHA